MSTARHGEQGLRIERVGYGHADAARLIGEVQAEYTVLYGSPDELLEKTQLMREAGCDMVSVFLSNPFTAERDIADIGASILARA